MDLKGSSQIQTQRTKCLDLKMQKVFTGTCTIEPFLQYKIQICLPVSVLDIVILKNFHLQLSGAIMGKFYDLNIPSLQSMACIFLHKAGSIDPSPCKLYWQSIIKVLFFHFQALLFQELFYIFRHFCFCGDEAGTKRNDTFCETSCSGNSSFSCGNGVLYPVSLKSVYGTKW